MATEHLDWFKPWDAVEEYDFDSDEPFVRYFRGRELNASCNCIDRHLNGPRRNKAALIWQGEPTEEVDVYTYQRLHREVCKAANMLRRLGVRKGDRVVLCTCPWSPNSRSACWRALASALSTAWCSAA